MWDFKQKGGLLDHTRVLVLSLLLLSPASTTTHANGTVNQNTAQKTAETLNRAASDDSLENSTVYAMQALMDLSALKVPSAVNNGITAYGKYRNSENLDYLGDKNALLSNSMSSLDGAGASKAVTRTDTTFRRLDPSFLRKGHAAKIAEEFEKKSGMPREKFLEQMSAISEKKISRFDPQLVDKVISRFESFVSQIPNPEFRKNLEKGIQMVPNTVRHGLVAKAVSKFAGMMAGGSPPPMESTVSERSLASNPSGEAQTVADAGAPAASDAVTGAENPSASAPMGDASSPIAFQESNERNGIGNIVQAALQEQTSESDLTIFQQVTRRYRMVTPLLSKVE